RRTARPPGVAVGPGRRRDHAGGARSGAGDPQPKDRPAGDEGDGRVRPLRGARSHPGCGSAHDGDPLPGARAADRERRPVRAGDDRGRSALRTAAEGSSGGHGDPRLHALSADQADLPADLRPRRHTRLLGGGDRSRSRPDARPQGDRERRGPRGYLPVHDYGRGRGLPRDRSALPPAADRGRRARAPGRPRADSRVNRADGRRPDQLRPVEIVPDYLEQPHGSVFYSQGKTRVLCTASIEEGVPRWMAGRGVGWITAEYSLLPASTGQRTQREASAGKQKGRTGEIQRLIGRAVRAVTDFEALGERTLWLDCDVLQADGGTRCAAISGAYVAARRALDRFGLAKAMPGSVAAVSLGIV